MPYNISKGVVHRNQRFLDDMLHGKKTLTWPAHDSGILAYKIREALFAAQRHPEFMPYHVLKNWYRIHARLGWVEAEYIGPIISEQDVQAPTNLTLGRYTSVEEIVGACIKFVRTADELHFPDAQLSVEDRTMLYRWGKTNIEKGQPDWNLIDHGEGGVTMTRKKGVEEMFLWKPEESND